LDFPWEASEEMDRLTANMKPPDGVRYILPK
jgi:hypothetical protein